MPETQAFSAQRRVWTPPSGTLGGLVRAAYARAAAQGHEEAEWRARAEATSAVASFRDALLRPTLSVVAEIKRSSPSKGPINPGMEATSRAKSYEDAGAAAISVLTEPDWFGGSMADLSAVAAVVSVPVLRKDFIVASVQLYEARARGASAALLIVRALRPEALAELHDVGSRIGLDLLVEVRDEAELAVALDVGATIVGVNNRDLESLQIDPHTVDRVLPRIPRGIVAVAESGMTSRLDLQRAAGAGADAVLIGSAVSAAADPGGMVRSYAGIPVERDARPS
jgi:indole-3-glycerol phosphate synthase